MSRKIVIEIWSDVVCPYCYIGIKKLEHALKSTGLTGFFEIKWHSFQLDPEFPVGSTENTTTYLAQRKGISGSQIRQIYSQLSEQGKIYGIDFQFDKALTFNTRNAHRIIQWSKLTGKTTQLENAFFKAYFTHGADLSKPDNLVAICESVGFQRQEVLTAFINPENEALIEEDSYMAKQLGIRGVPYFLIGEKFPVSGAMPDAVFENTLRNAYLHYQQSETANKTTIGTAGSANREND